MLLVQSQLCFVASTCWWPGMYTVDHGCPLCPVYLPSLVWGDPASRSMRSRGFRYRLGTSDFHLQRDEVFRGKLALSKSTVSMLRPSGAGSADQPLAAKASSPGTSPQSDQAGPSLHAVPGHQYSSIVSLPAFLPRSAGIAQLSMVDQAILLLGFIACTASFALFALIVTTIPTLHAMKRAAVSVEKLADVARDELPGTMAAIRLSGMEISDLTLELNDLSQEISDGVRNSAQAVQAAEVGIRRMTAVAASQTFAMLQGTASVPVQVVRPAVVSAAATTLHAVSQAQKLVYSLASSSYPHISGWLGQRGASRKDEKPMAKVTSPAELTEFFARKETAAAASFLLDSPELSLFHGVARNTDKPV